MQVKQNKSRFIVGLMLFMIGAVIGVCGAYQLISTKPQFPVDRDDFMLTEFNPLPSRFG